VQEGFIGSKSVVDRRRIRVLGAEPVVDGDDLGVSPPADLGGQVGGEEGVTHHVHAAVEVENNVARFDSVDCDLSAWDATQCGCGHRYVGGQRLRRQQLSEQPALLVDIAAGGEGRLSQDCVEGLSLLDAHGRISLRLGCLLDQLGDFGRVRDRRDVARRDLDRGRAHALRELPLDSGWLIGETAGVSRIQEILRLDPASQCSHLGASFGTRRRQRKRVEPLDRIPRRRLVEEIGRGVCDLRLRETECVRAGRARGLRTAKPGVD
jgi:hypothetical protein